MNRLLTLAVVLGAATGCQDFTKLYEDCTAPGGRCLSEGGQIRALGEACGALDRCGEGACVDGVCCDRACEGQCEACNLPGSEGTCVAVTGAPLNGRPACEGGGTTCGGACDGALTTACSYPTPVCREQGCSAGLETAAATCSQGACPALVTTACPGGICGDGACATVKQLASGYDYTCALLSDGSVWCWGDNGNGQLGVGDYEPRYVPTRVQGLTGVTAIAASRGGYHTCALLTSGDLQCWGANTYGQVGVGSAGGDFTTPQPVASLTDVLEISLGYLHSCAIVRSGGNFRAYCWGENSYGQLGDGTSTLRNAPVPVCTSGSGAACPGFTYQKDLALGAFHTCARNLNAVHCWGANHVGQLGFTKDFADHPNPVAVAGLTVNNTTQSRVLFAGYDVSCAINSAGAARCWGRNSDGQLANGTFTGDTHTPSPLCGNTGSPCAELVGVASFELGEANACARKTDGSVYCWGRDGHLELGDGLPSADNAFATSNVPVGSVVGLSLGSYHGCVWKDAEVQCWGWSIYGQLGNDDRVTDDQPNPVSPIWQ